ncbi:MAG: NADAR family protein [Gemmataceae bacterium]
MAPETPQSIHFYGVSDAFGEFSNFAPDPIQVGGKRWPTSEHYFQAQKFEDEAYCEKIRQAKSPMIAARLGRNRKEPLRRDWESVKIGIMRAAVLAKFSQHPELRKRLLSNENAKLVERTENDDYWGDSGDASGQNMLGRILMRVRKHLQRE